MEMIFAKVLRMSMTASLVIAIVCFARLLLKKVPKKVSYLLWAVVLFRLLCPLSIPSPISFLPRDTAAQTVVSRWSDTVIEEVRQESVPVVTFSEPISETVPVEHPIAPSPVAPVKAAKPSLPLPLILWLGGMCCFPVYSIVSLMSLRRKLGIPIRLRENIYYGEAIRSPFILGIVFPKIYLPSNLSESEREYVIAHEQFHVRHGDHLVKLLFFAALCIHWFNPVVWLAFALFSRDMEMRCDEAIVSKMDGDKRADYCMSLLNLAVHDPIPAGFSLSFGGSNTMHRIKNLAIPKKTGVGFVALTLVFSMILSACLATDPKAPSGSLQEAPTIKGEETNSFQIAEQPTEEDPENQQVLEAMYAELSKEEEERFILEQWRARATIPYSIKVAFLNEKGKYFPDMGQYTFSGDTMHIKVRVDSFAMQEEGLLLFLNGAPQPYHTEADPQDTYFKSFPSKLTYVYDLYFTPTQGQLGDILDLAVVAITDPCITLKDSNVSMQFTALPAAQTAKLSFAADTPGASLPEIENRVISLTNTASELTESDRKELIESNPYYFLPYQFSVNHSVFRPHGTVTLVNAMYNQDFSKPVEVSFLVFGDDVGEYGFNLYVNHQPVSQTALAEIHSEPGTKSVVTAALDLSGYPEDAVIYGILVAKNYDGYSIPSGAANNVLETAPFYLTQAKDFYEILGISDPHA